MKVAVVIPCFRVKNQILQVLQKIGEQVSRIYVVDDKCPDLTGSFVLKNQSDSRVVVLFNSENQGVGGAMVTGYQRAIEDKMDIVIKIDGDGQMDPSLIPLFVHPIANNYADYVKGNRFYRLEDTRKMPGIRLFGNAVLSFFNKISSGYWYVFDPTNGYTSISVECLKNLEIEKISKRYFFESDLLFRLNIIGAIVRDIPMKAVYDSEESSLKISKIILPFLSGHLRNFLKRIFYDYFLRDFSVASITLVFGLGLTFFGIIFGAYEWGVAVSNMTVATSGTVMLAALPIIVGTQLLLSFLNYDINKSKNFSVANFPIKSERNS